MRKLKIGMLVFSFISGCLASYWFGIKVAKDAFYPELSSTQAMLSFNHLQRYEELSTCLKSGNIKAASTKAKISAINERELLSSLLNQENSQWLNEYISTRSEAPLDSYRNYKSLLGNKWSEPSCK